MRYAGLAIVNFTLSPVSDMMRSFRRLEALLKTIGNPRDAYPTPDITGMTE